MATKTLTVPDVSWSYIRRVFYTLLVVWVFSVRVANIDPFGFSHLVTIAWLMDVLSLAAIWLVVWHFWELRPRVG